MYIDLYLYTPRDTTRPNQTRSSDKKGPEQTLVVLTKDFVRYGCMDSTVR